MDFCLLLKILFSFSIETCSSKYSQSCHAEKSATDALKTPLKRAIQKTDKATGDLIGNKIANSIMKVLKT